MGRRRSSPRVVGREEELALIRAAAGRAASGASQVVIVGGEAGVGKTRLVSEVAAELDADGASVLSGACVPVAGSELPLAPIAQGFRLLARRLSPGDLDAVLGPARTVLAPLIPALDVTHGTRDQVDAPLPTALFEHVLAVLDRLGARRPPAVVIVDDLQWADSSTRDLLAYLVRNLRDAPVLLVATYRSDGIEHGHPLRQLLAELTRSPLVERVELQPLGDDAIAEQLQLITGRKLDDAELSSIVSRAEGNPFFAEELVAASNAEPASLPATLRETLLATVASRPPELQHLLRVGSVLGPQVSPELLALASGTPLDVAMGYLRQAVEQGLLAPADAGDGQHLKFRHALTRELIYSELLAGERSHLHGAVARALTARPELSPGSPVERAVEVAAHWWNAGDATRAFPALVKAAAAAETIYAFPEAHQLYERAFALADRPRAEATRAIGFRVEAASDGAAEWNDLLRRAAEAASLAGYPEKAIERIETALTRSRDGAAGRAVLLERRARYLLELGNREDALEAYAQAADAAPDAQPQEHARVLASYASALVMTGRFREAVDVAESAARIGRAAGSRREEWRALSALGSALAMVGEVSRALEVVAEARRLEAERSAESRIQQRPSRVADLLGGYVNLATALRRAGRRKEALAVSLEGAEAARRHGSQTRAREMTALAARELFHAGRWNEAEQLCEEILEAGSDVVDARLTRAKIAVARGDWDRAMDELQVLEARSVLLTPEEVGALHIALAELGYWRRRLVDAAGAIEEGMKRLAESDDRVTRAELASEGIRVAAERYQEAKARRAASEAPHHFEVGTRMLAEATSLIGGQEGASAAGERREGAVLAAAAAEVSRMSTALPSLWRTASEAWDRFGEPYPAAYARYRLAEAELSEGSRQTAAEVVRSAFRTAEELGASPLRREITALAQRARIELAPSGAEARPRESRSEAPLGLSPRELDVLRLIALGRTNRQIADELFITEKTAGHHVSNILTKMDVASRVEAAGVAHRLGLTGSDL